MEVDETIIAPIVAGTSYGQLLISLNGEMLLEEPLVALDSVPEAGFWGRLWDSIVLFFTQLLGG